MITVKKRCLVLLIIALFIFCSAGPAVAEKNTAGNGPVAADLKPLKAIKHIDISVPVNLSPLLPDLPRSLPVGGVLNVSLNGSVGLSINVPPGTDGASSGGASDLTYDDWHHLLLASGYAGNNTTVIDFSDAGSLAPNFSSGPTPAPLWFNASRDYGGLSVPKVIEHKRIQALTAEMVLVNRSIAASGLGADDKARLAGSLENNARWLNAMDAEVQAAGDVKSLGDGITMAEGRMAVIRSELRANAGLLACADVDARIDGAINTSTMVNDKVDRTGIDPADRAWYDEELATFDGHLYYARLYTSLARGAFLGVPGSADGDARYADGLELVGMAQGEMGQAFAVLSGIFHRMNE